MSLVGVSWVCTTFYSILLSSRLRDRLTDRNPLLPVFNVSQILILKSLCSISKNWGNERIGYFESVFGGLVCSNIICLVGSWVSRCWGGNMAYKYNGASLRVPFFRSLAATLHSEAQILVPGPCFLCSLSPPFLIFFLQN